MSIEQARQDLSKGLCGWGRTYQPGSEYRTEDLVGGSRNATLSRGLGRSYGDASLPTGMDPRALGTTLADRILGFDETTGILRAEAGLCLAEMNRLYLKRNWFTPVTPGTKFVTLGGMVASDVHGKNHHVAGTIGQHVESLLMRVASGDVVRCSRTEHRDLFLATLGGMGLTGHILEVELRLERLPSPWIYTESYRASCLDELLEMVRESAKTWPMTVSWVDTVARGKALGRGILFVGRWATADEAPAGVPQERPAISAPFDLPSTLLNRFTIGLFNQAVYSSHFRKVKKGFVNPDAYFYPLDSLHHWNRFYGKQGVTQHQSVIPWEHGRSGVERLIQVLADAGTASFLTVIKDCGAEGDGILSFPRPGMSLALDIPIRKSTPQVIADLNHVVRETGGRIYLTKDGMTTAEDFSAMEPRLETFLAIKHKWDPENRIRSVQSDRLMSTALAQVRARETTTALGENTPNPLSPTDPAPAPAIRAGRALSSG